MGDERNFVDRMAQEAEKAVELEAGQPDWEPLRMRICFAEWFIRGN